MYSVWLNLDNLLICRPFRVTLRGNRKCDIWKVYPVGDIHRLWRQTCDKCFYFIHYKTTCKALIEIPLLDNVLEIETNREVNIPTKQTELFNFNTFRDRLLPQVVNYICTKFESCTTKTGWVIVSQRKCIQNCSGGRKTDRTMWLY